MLSGFLLPFGSLMVYHTVPDIPCRPSLWTTGSRMLPPHGLFRLAVGLIRDTLSSRSFGDCRFRFTLPSSFSA